MPKMKYFQELGNIREHLDFVLMKSNLPHKSQLAEDFDFNQAYLDCFGIKREDLHLLEEERESMQYLIDCQLGITRNETDVSKPSKEVLIRCFERRLDYVNKVFINNGEMNIPKSRLNRMTGVCTYYLFKLSYDVWYEKLPNVILTFSNKHPDYKQIINRGI